jgi:hypothetical protein
VEKQLSLFEQALPAAEDPLQQAFRRLAPSVTPTIVYAPARRRIFSWRSDPGQTSVVLRLGLEFRNAPQPVAEAIVRIVTRRRLPRDVRRQLFFEVRRWIAAVAPCGPGTGRFLPPGGRHVDLEPILARVNTTRFATPVAARIGWSEEPARQLMGRYERGDPCGLVVVNRLLDSAHTPAWYLEFLVYHELLHAVIPPRAGSTRLLIHPPEFRRLERRHEHHGRARQFERWVSGPGYSILLASKRTRNAVPARFVHAD